MYTVRLDGGISYKLFEAEALGLNCFGQPVFLSLRVRDCTASGCLSCSASGFGIVGDVWDCTASGWKTKALGMFGIALLRAGRRRPLGMFGIALLRVWDCGDEELWDCTASGLGL